MDRKIAHSQSALRQGMVFSVGFAVYLFHSSILFRSKVQHSQFCPQDVCKIFST